MSVNVIAPPPAAEPNGGRTKARGVPRGGREAAALLAPPAAALAALAVHALVPARQMIRPSLSAPVPFWLHPYPLVLEAVLGVTLLFAAAQGIWPRVRAWVRSHAPLWAGAVAVLAVWDLVTFKLDWLQLPYFPGPDRVFAAMAEDRTLLFECTWRSLLLLLSGYAAGVAAGLFTGVLIGWFPRVRYWGMPVMKVLGPIPATALVPLVMTLSSSSFRSGAALIALAVWFPVTMLTISGIANVPVSYFDVARTLGAGRRYLIFRVAVPAALPSIFVGLFMGLGASFLTLIVAESVGVKAGIGWYQTWQKGYVEYANFYASLIIMAAFFSTIMTLLFKLRDHVLGWQKGVIRW